MRTARRREEPLHPDGQPGHRRTTASARASSLLQAGVLGPVKEIHVWTNRPIWPQGIEPARRTPPASPTTCTGTSSSAPRTTARTTRRTIRSTGAAGSISAPAPWATWPATPSTSPPWAWSCSTPRAIEVVDTSGIVDRETYPTWSIIKTQFGDRNGRGPLSLTWYDGGENLPEEKRAYKKLLQGEKAAGSGLLDRRRKGLVLLRRTTTAPSTSSCRATSTRSSRSPSRLSPGRPATSPSGSRRIKAKRPQARPSRTSTTPAVSPRPSSWASSPCKAGTRIEWDAEDMKRKNNTDADQFIRRDYRKGFSIHV